jgi:membrane fusion protein (multidrug efflux system)
LSTRPLNERQQIPPPVHPDDDAQPPSNIVDYESRRATVNAPASATEDSAMHESDVSGSGGSGGMKIVIAVLVLMAIGGGWYLHHTSQLAKQDQSTTPTAVIELAPVDVAVVQARALTRSLPLSGNIAPLVQATIKSKVSGEVEQVSAREGQNVREGEVLVKIDTRNLQAQYDSQAAALEKAKADLSLAKLNRDKNRVLLDQHFISQNTFDATESAYAGNVASVKLAEAQARLAQINLQDAVVRAPFSGTLAKRFVQPGEKVSMDSSLLQLVDVKSMQLEAAIPTMDIPDVKVGQAVNVRVSGFGERMFEGKIQRINPVTEQGSRSITIYVTVANNDEVLRGGMFAQGDVLLDRSAQVLSVPAASIHREAGLPYIYTLSNGLIDRKPVTLGVQSEADGYVEIRSGASAGEQVIISNITGLNAGTRAVVKHASAASAKPTAQGG